MENGIPVDASQRTSNPDIYAAGDVANEAVGEVDSRLETGIRLGLAAPSWQVGRQAGVEGTVRIGTKSGHQVTGR